MEKLLVQGKNYKSKISETKEAFGAHAILQMQFNICRFWGEGEKEVL